MLIKSTHHQTIKQSRKSFSGKYSAYRSKRKSIPIESPPSPLPRSESRTCFAKRGKKKEYDESKTRVIKHNESTGKITTYINDLFDIEDGEEKIYFFSGDLKLATLDGSSEVGGGETTCTIPTSGNWTITQDCTIATFETAPADVTITAGTTLTIASTGILEVDLNNNSITIEDTGGILVENGGSLAQTNLLTPPQGGGQSTPTLSFHHSDHLSGASVDTDINGDILQITDYYPYGDSRIEDTTSDFHNDYTYTGKERDEDTDLLYYEARYYNSNIGRFISLDPWSGDITDPQSLNKYAYVRNNPLKYKDPSGEYWETAIDAVFFALSLRDYQKEPNFVNGVFAGIDGAALVTPVPAAVGYVKNGAKAGRIISYFDTVAKDTGKSTTKIASTFAKNSLFNQSRRSWSSGKPGDSLANLVGHFEKHGAEFGAKNVDEYYQSANNFIDDFGKNVDNVTWKEGNSTVLWDKKKNTVGYLDKDGNIQSVYKPTNKNKIDDLNRKRESAKKKKQNENKV